jgi:hypothetical protein
VSENADTLSSATGYTITSTSPNSVNDTSGRFTKLGTMTTRSIPGRGTNSTPLVAASMNASMGIWARASRFAAASRSRMGRTVSDSGAHTRAIHSSRHAMSSALSASGSAASTPRRYSDHESHPGCEVRMNSRWASASPETAARITDAGVIRRVSRA